VVSNAWGGGEEVREEEREVQEKKRRGNSISEERIGKRSIEEKTRQDSRSAHFCDQEILNISFITVTYDHYSSY
jgi:hypothetical protein